ncbi:hypothetical protein FOZ63_032871 [Perkinsus olseni]|uniref:Uncharacterized protein n=1 Tax=Perkinsus olseni TaxID=32597 RepID=A0A7J6TE59_PEROL|nr:hypothetical protein FOZ63_032871 [Perkinsus olseni]
MKDFPQLDPSKKVFARSLKMHFERHLFCLLAGTYTRKFTSKSEFYAVAGGRSRNEEESLLFEFYLSRPDAGQAFRLTGVYASLSATKGRYIGGTITPRLNASRLYDLLSNAKEVAPKPGYRWWRERPSETIARQLAAYSKYVSEARGNMMALDIWPASFGDSVTKDGLILVDLLHWLMRGSMKT